MNALELLKSKLGALEQDSPFVEQKMQSLIDRQNKKLGMVNVPLDNILKLDKEELGYIRDVIGFQIQIINHSELIQEANKQIRDYQQAIERLEVES